MGKIQVGGVFRSIVYVFRRCYSQREIATRTRIVDVFLRSCNYDGTIVSALVVPLACASQIKKKHLRAVSHCASDCAAGIFIC
jgi:hypothetical protein